MPEALSDYEQQRLDNIARNKAQLALLGLADEDPLGCKQKKPPPRKKEKDDDEDEQPQPTRRSSRQSNAPTTYMSLSDEWCRAEEKQLEREERRRATAPATDRPQRKRSVPATYADQQADAILETEELNAKRRRAREKERRETEAKAQREAFAAIAASCPMLPPMQSPMQSNVPMPVGVAGIEKKASAVGPAARCWRCGELWAIRKSDGRIRSHTCIPMQSVLASGAASAPSGPVLPAM